MKTCPYGDNPKTVGVNEVQRVVCTADGGSFTLTFRQHTTSSIYYNAAASLDYVQLATVRNFSLLITRLLSPILYYIFLTIPLTPDI